MNILCYAYFVYEIRTIKHCITLHGYNVREARIFILRCVSLLLRYVIVWFTLTSSPAVEYLCAVTYPYKVSSVSSHWVAHASPLPGQADALPARVARGGVATWVGRVSRESESNKRLQLCIWGKETRPEPRWYTAWSELHSTESSTSVWEKLESSCIQLFMILFNDTICSLESRDSAVGIPTGYRLDDQGVGVRVSVGASILISPCRPDRLWGSPSLLSDALPGALSPGVKRPGREADHSPSTVLRSRKRGFIHLLPHTSSWCSA
jgi:hypothetical protein